MAKFNIEAEDGLASLEAHLSTGQKGVAWLFGYFFTLEKTGESLYRAYYSSRDTGIVEATGEDIMSAINNVSEVIWPQSSGTEEEQWTSME